jgi:hypothetical protein
VASAPKIVTEYELKSAGNRMKTQGRQCVRESRYKDDADVKPQLEKPNYLPIGFHRHESKRDRIVTAKLLQIETKFGIS